MMMLLHAGKPIEPHDLWEAWAFEPGVVICLAVAAGLYFAGRRRSQQASTSLFVLGWVSLVIALVSPLHPLGSALFSAHMVQHEILMLVAAPLLVLSRPLSVFVWALPREWRVNPIPRLWHRLTTPWFAWSFHAVALWAWHIPLLFDATIESEFIHTLQHASFFVSALLFWWALFHRREARLGYGASVFYLFTTGLHSGVLGALLTFARVPWYPAYADSVKAWGITALEDQQLAGLIMWVPAGCVYLAAGLALFAAWMKESEWKVEIRRSAGLMLVLISMVSVLVLTSCSSDNVARAAAEMTGGNPQQGRTAVRTYGCAACHTVPGVPGADAVIGPSLEHIANRAYIAGTLPNNPGNMIQWLLDPRHVNPHTAMPKTLPNETEARNIAAYLYTLE